MVPTMASFSLPKVCARQPNAAGHFGCKMLPSLITTSSTEANSPSFMSRDGSKLERYRPYHDLSTTLDMMKLMEPGA